MTPISRVVYSLLKCTLVVRVCLRTASKSQLLAQVIPAVPADTTLSTRNSDLKRDTISNFEAVDLRTNSDHFTRGFVTERKWLACAQVTIGEFLIVRNIRATDAGGFDSNLQLAKTRFFQAP